MRNPFDKIIDKMTHTNSYLYASNNSVARADIWIYILMFI